MKKILIVDDDIDFLGLITMQLGKNFEIDTCHNAKDALMLIETYSYGTLVLDVSLPDYTGYYLGKLVRNSNKNLPIIFLTNYDGDVTRDNAEDINATVFRKVDILGSPQVLIEKINRTYYAEKNRDADCTGQS